MFGYIENALVILSRAFLCCLRRLDVGIVSCGNIYEFKVKY